MKTVLKHILLLVAALSFFSCRKDVSTGKWVLSEYTVKSDVLDQHFTHQFDTQGRLTQIKEEMKNVTDVYVVFTYDNNTITRLIVPDPSDLEVYSSKIVFTLDNSGKIVKSEDKVTGQSQTFSYSPDGFLEKITEKDGRVTVYTWNNNSLLKAEHPDGRTVKYTYSNNESLGLFSPDNTVKPESNLVNMGYFGKISRLLPAKKEETTQDSEPILSVEYEYTSFDANALPTGYTQTSHMKVGTHDIKSANHYSLKWTKIQ